MKGALSIQIITPKGVLAKVTADALVAPGELGEFEVLPGHVPMLTSLRTGRMIVGEKSPERYAVAGGYLRVDAAGTVEVLVEQAVKGTDVVVDDVRAQLKDAEAQVAKCAAVAMDADFQTATYKLDWARAQLAAAGHGATH